jgi:mannosylglucosylglycerate synthase
MSLPKIAILHYSAPPVIGGVEAVIEAHARLLVEAGYPLTVIAGRGDESALPPEVQPVWIPEIDSRHPRIIRQNSDLQEGNLPQDFEGSIEQIHSLLFPIVRTIDVLIVHNVFTKHFNLGLTAALFSLIDEGVIKNCIAWCHDFTWTSPHSRTSVFPGMPWDLLRTQHPRIKYVTVSKKRQQELAGLFGCNPDQIEVVYNGVDPVQILGLSEAGHQLAMRLGLFESDLVLLMPVRVTQAKNIEYAMHLLAEIKEHGIRPKTVLTGPLDPHDEESMDYFHHLLDLRRELDVEEEMQFVYNSGPDPDEPFLIDSGLVGEFYRMSDLLLMPSHREGFGIPVLEAGLAGIPVFSTSVPAAVEIGEEEVIYFDPGEEPARVAVRILEWAKKSKTHSLRRRVRQNLTWQAIFRKQIEPLIEECTRRQDALSR